MAETTIWNRRLLVISLILGAVAVALFYLYDSMQQAKVRGDTTEFLRWKRDVDGGNEIAQADIEVVTVPRSAQSAYEGALKNIKEDWSLIAGAHVQRNVRRAEPVRYNDIVETQTARPSGQIEKGMRAFPIQVDPNSTTGGLLRSGDRVDLVGLVSLKGRPPKAYTLIQNLRVLGIGGRPPTAEEDYGSSAQRRVDPGMMIYRSITVEVKPEVAEQLVDLLPRVSGRLTVVVRNPTDTSGTFHGRINPAIEPVLSQPLPELPAGGGGP